MNTKQVQKFLLSYLEATNCQIIEKTPNQVTVKLSPVADRALTNRLYYWGFVDRAGIEPETMTYTWTFGIPPADERKVPTQLSYLLTPGAEFCRNISITGPDGWSTCLIWFVREAAASPYSKNRPRDKRVL
ncbi:YqhG family protein [Cohnella kolymensis]|uniref:YqhG family protein n=1 Tax=Cohnella kolymensis TaxID=1590652 RepID=UPI000698D5E0|nr:YqhG family protein [Cohnella kolymensis]